MCRVLGILGLCMLSYVLYLHVTLGKEFADMALGYAAGLMVASCGVCIHRYYRKKGEVR